MFADTTDELDLDLGFLFAPSRSHVASFGNLRVMGYASPAPSSKSQLLFRQQAPVAT